MTKSFRLIFVGLLGSMIVHVTVNPFLILQVNEILSKSSVWSAFKDQKHDLFISDSQTAGYLTGEGIFILLFLHF